MPKFSQSSFSKLSTCHIDIQAIFFEVIRTIDCTVLQGYRNQEEQEKAFKEGFTKLNWPDGKHNSQPSLAVDVSPYPIDWKDIKKFYWFSGYVIATADQLKQIGKITHSVRWGGDWDCDRNFNNNKFNDLVHFELII